MTRRVDFRRSALADLRAATRWYEKQRPGLGERFVDEVERALEVSVEAPNRLPHVLGDIRRIRVRRFPHFIYFIVDGTRLVVLAVLHFRRDPESWKSLKV